MRPVLAVAAFALLGAAGAMADEQPVSLAALPGREAVETHCAACHSLDYLSTNARFLDRKVWQAEVDKMIKVFGAPIESAEATAIVDYLEKAYGTGG